MKVAITGANGFIGKNVIEFLRHELPQVNLQLIDRNLFNSKQLIERIKNCEFIVHCAGINRSDNVYEENIQVKKVLLDAIQEVCFSGTLVNLSSVHAVGDTDYGEAKRDIEKSFKEHSVSNRYNCISLRLPNVYGPYSRENYNTVVATFVHNELTKVESQVNAGEIDLIYVKNVCVKIKDILIGVLTIGDVYFVPPDVRIGIRELFLKIRNLVTSSVGTRLELKSDLDKNLFRTITYFRMTLGMLQSNLIVQQDERGWFSELLHLDGRGQVSISRTVGNTPRGNHYHTKKLERFIVISGEGEVELISFNGDKWKFNLKPLSAVDIPNYYIHTLKKTSEDDLICAFWVDEFYDMNNPDTFYI